MSVATVLRKLCELMSGTPNSSRILRHCPAKLSGSRSVPFVDGKMTDCCPRYGRLRRSVSVAMADVGSGMTLLPTAVLVSSTPLSAPPYGCHPRTATLGCASRVRSSTPPSHRWPFEGRNWPAQRLLRCRCSSSPMTASASKLSASAGPLKTGGVGAYCATTSLAPLCKCANRFLGMNLLRHAVLQWL